MDENPILNPFQEPISSQHLVTLSGANTDDNNNDTTASLVSAHNAGKHIDKVHDFRKFDFVLSRYAICFTIMLSFATSVLLVIIVFKYLRTLLKLYAAVAFYAVTCVYFVFVVVFMLISDKVGYPI